MRGRGAVGEIAGCVSELRQTHVLRLLDRPKHQYKARQNTQKSPEKTFARTLEMAMWTEREGAVGMGERTRVWVIVVTRCRHFRGLSISTSPLPPPQPPSPPDPAHITPDPDAETWALDAGVAHSTSSAMSMSSP